MEGEVEEEKTKVDMEKNWYIYRLKQKTKNNNNTIQKIQINKKYIKNFRKKILTRVEIEIEQDIKNK